MQVSNMQSHTRLIFNQTPINSHRVFILLVTDRGFVGPEKVCSIGPWTNCSVRFPRNFVASWWLVSATRAAAVLLTAALLAWIRTRCSCARASRLWWPPQYELSVRSVLGEWMNFEWISWLTDPLINLNDGIGHRTLTIGGSIPNCTAVLQFDWFGFDRTSKTVVHSTLSKHLNPNKIKWRLIVKW